MRKTWLIWQQTFLANVRHPAFLMFTLGLPGILAAVSLATAYFVGAALDGDRRPAAVVDPAGALIPVEQWRPADLPGGAPPLRSLPDEANALAGLRAGRLQAYYLVPPNYLAGGEVTEVAAGPLNSELRGLVKRYLTEGLLRATPAERRLRISAGATLLHRSLTDQRENSFQAGFQWGLVAFVLAAFYFINSSSTADMLGILREEKTRNTIEISLTSASVEQLLAGKAAGLISGGLAQFAIWAVAAASITAAAWRVLRLPPVSLAAGPLAGALALSLALLLPAYVMSVSGTIVVGSLVSLAGRGEQVANLLASLAGTLAGPLALAAFSSPDNPVIIVFSLLPFTSPLIMIVRFMQVVVPAWQLAAAIGLVWGLMIVNLLLSARLYRASWLAEGQRNWLKAAWLALRG
jgi:ABC-type Na+ efflux pump permease subunit